MYVAVTIPTPPRAPLVSEVAPSRGVPAAKASELDADNDVATAEERA
jgi:hypothetical protein